MTLRHSLCANPGLSQRVTLIPRGLGNETTKCTIYSIDNNQGDGTIYCNPSQNMSSTCARCLLDRPPAGGPPSQPAFPTAAPHPASLRGGGLPG